MIKMTMLLKRKAGLSHEDFVRHHVEKHGPLFRSIPEAGVHCLRYIQTHPVRLTTDAVTNADFDGTAELWFDSEAGMAAVLGSDTYKNDVFPDEQTFLDHENTLILVGEQVEIIGDSREDRTDAGPLMTNGVRPGRPPVVGSVPDSIVNISD